jgi:hypothetical protein
MDEALDASQLVKQGSKVADIRKAIDRKYGK